MEWVHDDDEPFHIIVGVPVVQNIIFFFLGGGLGAGTVAQFIG